MNKCNHTFLYKSSSYTRKHNKDDLCACYCAFCNLYIDHWWKYDLIKLSNIFLYYPPSAYLI